MRRVIVSAFLTIFMILSIIQPAFLSEPEEPKNANALWIEPSILYLDPDWIDIGYKFYFIIWANTTLETIHWQFRLIYANVYINAIDAGYTLGWKSEFFSSILTSSFPPYMEARNSTHNLLEFGESRGGGSGESVIGCGSLAWVEFEIVALPPNDEPTEISIDIASTYPERTFLKGLTIDRQPMTVHNSLVSIGNPPPNAPPPPDPPSIPPMPDMPTQPEPAPHKANAMWVEPQSVNLFRGVISLGYRFNVTVWVNASVDTLHWQFWMVYNKSYIVAKRAGYSAGERSAFYYDCPTISVSPHFDEYNETHNRVAFGELAGMRMSRSPGYGSLAWVEFEIVEFPQEHEILEIPLDIAYEKTCLAIPDDNGFDHVSLSYHNGLVRLVGSEDAFLPEFNFSITTILFILLTIVALIQRKKKISGRGLIHRKQQHTSYHF